MFYFKFDIPTNADGTTVTYSPGWCGTRDKCALKEKGIYYNDKERWGIAIAEGSFVPPDVEVVDAGKVAELMGIKTVVDKTAVIAMDAEGSLKFNNVVAELPEITEKEVYYGKKLADRYLPKIDAVTGDTEIDEKLYKVKASVGKTVFCPECHVFVMKLPNGLNAKTINLTCPNGHKVVLSG
jgi:hypothetical protein